MASVEPETLKACSSRRRMRRGVLNGEGYSLPSRLGGLGKRRKLPLRGPGRKTPAKNDFTCFLSVSERLSLQRLLKINVVRSTAG